jgi:Holliday junction DNA helicase RuvA
MIGYITGTIVHNSIGGKSLTVATASGVGYRILVPQNEPYSLGDSISLYITTVVREDALDLFGFASSDERELFEVLTSVSGVGPRTGLGILATTTPSTLASAIAGKDIQFLTTLSGIGKKTAEKICIDLSEKIKKLSFETSHKTLETELVEALVSMGYQSRDIAYLMQEHTFVGATLEARIREALSRLSEMKK